MPEAAGGGFAPGPLREPPSPATGQGARIIEEAFLSYIKEFQRYTVAARLRFEAQDWGGILQDSSERLDAYSELASRAVEGLTALFGPAVRDKSTWCALKPAFRERVGTRTDLDVAETFFNSITRRIFTTVGVDAEIEFVESGAVLPDPDESTQDVAEVFPCNGDLRGAVARLLRRHEFSVGTADLAGDAAAAARAIESACAGDRIDALEMARWVFFRNKGAYLIGRLLTSSGQRPLAIALGNASGRVGIDAVLATEDEVSIVFSFTRSYFFVDAPRPAALVSFLRSIMPRKPVSELYSAIGHSKHGKTVFHRDLLDHLATTGERFDFAPGCRGMVMIVFAMPGFDAVFKVIRDHFAPPKCMTRQQVKDKYRLVFRHDRAGRLIDAQEFEFLRFERSRFTEALLDELATDALEAVEITADAVIVRHVYTERKVTPLDIYLPAAKPDAARAALLEYGNALRDLAATNIFPGDLFFKNFGVTRHGRLVFYDYDELALLTDCNFRPIPLPRDEQEELAAEPWYSVGPADYFPEEFPRFLPVGAEHRQAFLAAHGELFEPEFWNAQQQRHRAGIVPDLYPYPTARRLRP